MTTTDQNVMERTISGLDEKLDYFLHKISTAPSLTLNLNDLYEADVLEEDIYLLDQVMLEKGLIKIEGGERVITGKGLEIANFGGWIAYQKQFGKELRKKLVSTTTDSSKYEKLVGELRIEIDLLKNELQDKTDKENSSAELIKSLMEQKKNLKTTMILTGAVIGFSFATLLWVLFSN
jgi:hypothetical protein